MMPNISWFPSMSQLADVTVGPHLKVPCVKVSPQTINRKVFESVEKSLSDSAVWGKGRERKKKNMLDSIARVQKYVCFLLMRRQKEDRDAPSLEASLQAVGRRV